MNEKTLILTLKEHSASFLEATNSYLATFNGEGILTLFTSENDKSKYLERYSAFSLKLSDTIAQLEEGVSNLSRLICELESLQKLEDVARLFPVFEECEIFLASISKFIESNDRNFKTQEHFSPAHTISSARELKTAVLTFKERING